MTKSQIKAELRRSAVDARPSFALSQDVWAWTCQQLPPGASLAYLLRDDQRTYFLLLAEAL
jgi:hypothetical protein